MAAPSYVKALLPAPFNTGSAGYKDFRWNNDQPVGTPDTITFSFMTVRPNHAPTSGDGKGFAQFTAAQKDAARAIFDLYQEVSGITFDEKFSPSPDTRNANAEILLGRNTNILGAGYAYNPELLPPTDNIDGGPGGDVWIGKFPNPDPNQEVAPGEAGWQTLVHEIGHALGFKHPGNFAPGDQAPYLPKSTNSQHYTVMSYIGIKNYLWRTVTDDGLGGYTIDYAIVNPSGPMLYDVAAIQYLYGKNMTTRTGDDVYDFDLDTPFFKCIWDAGGTDTISVDNFDVGCKINLNAGQFSDIKVLPDAMPDGYFETNKGIYNGTKNLSIAFGATIENATGGSGDDRLVGNKVANVLTGNDGNDTLQGGTGGDSMVGGAGNDSLSGGPGMDTMEGGADDDTYVADGDDVIIEAVDGGFDTTRASVAVTLAANVEDLVLTGDANVNGTGNDDANTITGNKMKNSLSGMGGDDSMSGGDGADTMDGGEGSDSMLGGAGGDKLVWDEMDVRVDGGGGTDTLLFGGVNLDLTAVDDGLIVSVEQLDLTNDLANILTVAEADVLAMSPVTRTLKIMGEFGDTIDIVGDFTIGTVSKGFRTYTAGIAKLLVDTDIIAVI